MWCVVGRDTGLIYFGDRVKGINMNNNQIKAELTVLTPHTTKLPFHIFRSSV